MLLWGGLYGEDEMSLSMEAGFDFGVHYQWADKTLEGRKLSPKLVGYTYQDIVRSVFRRARARDHISTTVEKSQLRLQ